MPITSDNKYSVHSAVSEISRILTTDGRNSKPVVLTETKKGCIVSTSHKVDTHGYLHLHRSGKYVYAHRMVYEAFYGPIPEGLDICHHCDNRACLNPHHFFAGTQTDNNRDRDVKGRTARQCGEKNGYSKLVIEKVLAIRQKYQTGEFTQIELGKESGISQSRISEIVNGKAWTHLKGDSYVE